MNIRVSAAEQSPQNGPPLSWAGWPQPILGEGKEREGTLGPLNVDGLGEPPDARSGRCGVMGREGKLWGWRGIDPPNGPRRDAGQYHIEVVLSRRRHCHCHRGEASLPVRTHAQRGVPDGPGCQEVRGECVRCGANFRHSDGDFFWFLVSATGGHSSTTTSFYRCRTYVADQQLRGPREVIFNVFAVSGRPGDSMSMIVCGLFVAWVGDRAEGPMRSGALTELGAGTPPQACSVDTFLSW